MWAQEPFLSWPPFALAKGGAEAKPTHLSWVRLRAVVSPWPFWASFQEEASGNRQRAAQGGPAACEMVHRRTGGGQGSLRQSRRMEPGSGPPGYTVWALEHSTCLPASGRGLALKGALHLAA